MATMKIAIDNIGNKDLVGVLNKIKNHNFPYKTFEELGIDEDANIRLICESEEDDKEGKVTIMWDMMEEDLDEGFNVYQAKDILNTTTKFEIKEEEFAVIKEDTLELMLSMDMKNPKGMNAIISNECDVEIDEEYITLFKIEDKEVIMKLNMLDEDVAKSIIQHGYKLIVGPKIIEVLI